jgi:hypothetical protein
LQVERYRSYSAPMSVYFTALTSLYDEADSALLNPAALYLSLDSLVMFLVLLAPQLCL